MPNCRHQWYTWYDKDMHRNRTACYRCGAEKSKMIDSDIKIGYF